MLSQRLANMIFAVCLFGVCGYLATIAWGFEAVGLLGTSGVPPSLFPLLMLGLIAFACIVVFWTYFKTGAAGGDHGQTVFEGRGEARRGLLMIVLAVICYFLWMNVGFIPMAALMSIGALVAMGVRSLLIYAIVVALAALIYVMFTQLLGAQLG